MAGAGTHDAVLELIRRLLPEPASVLDLAAGQGAFSVKLRELGHDVRAVDVTPDNWKAADIPLAVANLDSEFASSVSSTGERFDAIAAIEILEHLENPFRFIRECSKLLKPGGLLFLTSPNVEAVSSRVMFLYTGRLIGFGAYETVRPAHITPIFKWKLDMMLDEAGLGIVHESYNRVHPGSNGSIKPTIAALIARLLAPVVKGEKGGEGRIVVARLNA
jgi:2-polyprenyl-3-methyl-5-hydroxy-6-metoxy-1,4-benzoquinol methylase